MSTAEPVRKIIHCDCDSFYASIEVRDDPSLKGKAIAVGGAPDQRGVIATCSYEARAYGVHSAMASGLAIKKCPGLIIIPPSMDKYREAAQQIFAIYKDYTPLVEPLSLDEAYLDVTGVEHCQGSATLMAEEIRQRVHDQLRITVSAGVAPNKFLAKIASDWRKPNGLYTVAPQDVDAFVAALPVKKLHGVGKVTGAKLESLGIESCLDLRNWAQEELIEHFGSFGTRLFQLCRGIDPRPVQPSRIRKSVSVEKTFVTDLPDVRAARQMLRGLRESLDARIARADVASRIEKLFVKVRFSDFSIRTAETASDLLDDQIFISLLDQVFLRNPLPARLIGLGVRLAPHPLQQLPLFET
ncbi:MAG: DNA polymerase IV [Pigmentiphaga sp.]